MLSVNIRYYILQYKQYIIIIIFLSPTAYGTMANIQVHSSYKDQPTIIKSPDTEVRIDIKEKFQSKPLVSLSIDFKNGFEKKIRFHRADSSLTEDIKIS